MAGGGICFTMGSNWERSLPFFDMRTYAVGILFACLLVYWIYRMLKKKNAMMARLKEIMGIDSSGDEHKD